MNGNTHIVSLFLAFVLLLFPVLQVFLCGFFKKRAGGRTEAAAIQSVCLRQAMLDIGISGGAFLIVCRWSGARGLLWGLFGLLAALLFVQLGSVLRTLKQCQRERTAQNMAHRLLALVLSILHILLILWAAGILF